MPPTRLRLRSVSRPTFTVTLVHGTFADETEWVEPDSPFSLSLSATTRVQVIPFRWSGKNTVTARAAATETLVEELKSTIKGYPDARHVVMGHSHGGAIALNACLDERVRGSVDGVVCLATPFVRIARRPGNGMLAFLSGAVAVLAVGLWISVVMSAAFSRLVPAWASAGGVFVAFLAVTLLAAGLRQSYYAAIQLLNRQPELYAGGANVLIVRSSADEATAGLAAAQAASWLTHSLWRILRHSQELFWSFAASESMAASEPNRLHPDPAPALVLRWTLTKVLPYSISIGAFLVASVIIGPVAIALGLLSTAFGIRSVLAGLLLSISVEPTPPGSWLVQQLEESPEGGWPLNHSAVLSPKVAEDVLVPWMLRLGERRAANDAIGLPATWSGGFSGVGTQEMNVRSDDASFVHDLPVRFSRLGTITLVLESVGADGLEGHLTVDAVDTYDVALGFVEPLSFTVRGRIICQRHRLRFRQVRDWTRHSAVFMRQGVLASVPRLWTRDDKAFQLVSQSSVLSFECGIRDGMVEGELVETVNSRGRLDRDMSVDVSLWYKANMTLSPHSPQGHSTEPASSSVPVREST